VALGNPRLLAFVSVVLLALAGCATDRLAAVPRADTRHASVYGIPDVRYFGGDTAPLIAEFQKSYEREVNYLKSVQRPLLAANYLAISGGGDDGAFGAGLLVGWSERGTRPMFMGVSGVSAGALIAPFVFLGPQYDRALTEVYTTIDQKNIFNTRFVVEAMTSDSLSDTAPLQELIAKYFDQRMVGEIAREYQRGRLLFIITTDLDAGRPVIWNIGAIAESGNPESLALIRRILLASAAIPAVFPPVMFDVTVDGAHYQELHVDGGAFAQTFLYPPTISIGKLGGIGHRTRNAYLIRNGKLREEWSETERKTLPIATRAVSSLITSNGVGDLYRIYAVTKRDGVEFNLAYIDDDFTEPHPIQFDRDYMNKLFNYARAKAVSKNGYPWAKGPPGFTQ
jgi:hypothetical protein